MLKAASYFCGNWDTFDFSGYFDEQKLKRTEFEIKTFCNIINTVTCVEFNASLVSKYINLLI